jgi:hypothetical protein
MSSSWKALRLLVAGGLAISTAPGAASASPLTPGNVLASDFVQRRCPHHLRRLRDAGRHVEQFQQHLEQFQQHLE